MSYRVLLAAFIWFLPQYVCAVSVSEVAWMGSTASANHEWIELYNAGGAVSVDGWTLTDGMNLTIALAGTIPGSSYAVLERTSDASAPGVAFLVYSGALVNTGATLTLRRADGTIADQVVGGENWESIGGDNVTKETAQYSGTRWVTAAATPGAQNATEDSPRTDDDDTKSAAAPSTSGGGGGRAKGKPAQSRTIVLNDVPSQAEITLVFPETVTVGQPVSFTTTVAKLGRALVPSLAYTWNFGDLTTATGSAVTHTYHDPGTYTVSVRAAYAGHAGEARATITVLPQQLSLAYAPSGDLFVHNDARYEVDISGFTVVAGNRIAVPEATYLAPGATLTIPRERLGGPVAVPLLLGRAGQVVATRASVEEVSPTFAAARSVIETVSPSAAVSAGEASSVPLVLAPEHPARADTAPSPLLAGVAASVPAKAPVAPYLPYLGLVAVILIGVLAVVAGQVSLRQQAKVPPATAAPERPSPFL